MKKLILLFVLIPGVRSSYAQMTFLPKFIRKMYFNTDTSRHTSALLLPAFSSSPETGIEFGGAALISFYADTAGHNTRISNLFGYATLTTKAQTKLSLNSSYWLPQNKFHFTAAVSYYNFPYNFYGIGNNTKMANVDHVSEKRYKGSLNGEMLFGKYIYAGFVSGLIKAFYKYSENRNFILDSDPSIEDRHGGPNLYFGPSFTFDTRNNNTYTTKGLVVNAYYQVMKGIFSNNSYTGGFFNIEYSQFFALNKQLVLGVDVQEQSLTGSRSPFYLLPELGSDEMMRGYYSGRFRDRNLLAGQTELRYRITSRLGLAGFVGTGEVFHSDFSFAALKPDYGGGLRYFFDVEKGLAIRLDYGVGEKPAGESRISGFYIALGQSF